MPEAYVIARTIVEKTVLTTEELEKVFLYQLKGLVGDHYMMDGKVCHDDRYHRHGSISTEEVKDPPRVLLLALQLKAAIEEKEGVPLWQLVRT